MKVHILAKSGHQAMWGGAFADGLRRHGIDSTIGLDWRACDLLVTWGIRRKHDLGRQRKSGGEICVLERGYLGDRFAWTSVSFGGELNGRAEFRGLRDDPTRFWMHHPEMAPWKPARGYALLIGQVPGDMSLAGIGGNLDGWYAMMARQLEEDGWTVRFRPHPAAVAKGKNCRVAGVETLGGSLSANLAAAGLVATWNSNTAVEAVLAGVPTIAMDRGSMAWPVTGHAVTEIVTPDRETWAARLAWAQWSEDEMRSGECWEAVKT